MYSGVPQKAIPNLSGEETQTLNSQRTVCSVSFSHIQLAESEIAESNMAGVI